MTDGGKDILGNCVCTSLSLRSLPIDRWLVGILILLGGAALSHHVVNGYPWKSVSSSFY